MAQETEVVAQSAGFAEPRRRAPRSRCRQSVPKREAIFHFLSRNFQELESDPTPCKETVATLSAGNLFGGAEKYVFSALPKNAGTPSSGSNPIGYNIVRRIARSARTA
jgi:hypothetical protein